MRAATVVTRLILSMAPVLSIIPILTAVESSPMETVLIPSSSPLVSFRILFRVGSAADPQGKEGLASLTAALLAGGGSAKRSYAEIVEAMYPMAASFSAQVDKEMTVFYGTTHLDNLRKYFGLISEMLLEPGWRGEDFNRVKTDAINFLKVNLRGTNDEELAKEALYQSVYRAHPYGHDNTGRVSTLEKLTLDDLRNFYREKYTAENLTLGLSGGYPQDFLAEAKARFGTLPRGARPAPALPGPPAISGLEVEIVEKKARATAISLGFPLDVTRGHKDWPALYLMQSYFGQHRSSTSYLYQRLRELRGLNYGDYAYIEYYPRGMFLVHPEPNLARRQQIFQIWIRPVEPQNAHFALRAALYELEKLVKNGITQKDFESTRRFLSKFVNVLTRTQDLQLGYLLDSKYYGIPEFTDYVKKELARLTLADVNRAIREHLQARDIKIVIVAGEAEELKKALVNNTPSPIQYNAPKPQELLDEDKIIEKYPLRISPDKVRIVPVDAVFQ